MASLIEELIETLTEEELLYKELLPVAEEKTKIIIENNLEELQRITTIEQEFVDKIAVLENQRQKTISNIGIVMSQDVKNLTLTNLSAMLKNQPKEQEALNKLHDGLKDVLERIREVNVQNKSLIEQSLEMIEFNMNVMQSERVAPVNNYNRTAATMDIPFSQRGMFDAKQ